MPAKYRRLTPEVLAEIAKKYKTRREFYDHDPSAFVSASRKTIEAPDPKKKGKTVEIRLLDHICAHMYKKRFRWTPDMLKNVADQYNTRGELAKDNKAAYSAAVRQGILEEVCAHMTDQRGTLWTEKKLKSLAKKHGNPEKLRRNNVKAYNAAKRRGLLETLFGDAV